MTNDELKIQRLQEEVDQLKKDLKKTKPKRWVYYPEDDYIFDREMDLHFEFGSFREELTLMGLWNDSATEQWNDFICMILECNDVEDYRDE